MSNIINLQSNALTCFHLRTKDLFLCVQCSEKEFERKTNKSPLQHFLHLYSVTSMFESPRFVYCVTVFQKAPSRKLRHFCLLSREFSLSRCLTSASCGLHWHFHQHYSLHHHYFVYRYEKEKDNIAFIHSAL